MDVADAATTFESTESVSMVCVGVVAAAWETSTAFILKGLKIESDTPAEY